MVQTEQGADRSFLHADFADIAAHGERYQTELKSRPRLLEMLFGIATGVYLPWCLHSNWCMCQRLASEVVVA